jgi:hexosaminidase
MFYILAAQANYIDCEVAYPLLFPLPKSVKFTSEGSCFLTGLFSFVLDGDSPSLLRDSATTYSAQLQEVNKLMPESGSEVCAVSSCSISVTSDAEVDWFKDTKDEMYEISFNDRTCKISCSKMYGCMHGMKTFVQLVDPVAGRGVPNEFRISDEPRFPHRGLLIDTSRHFLPINVIKDHIDMLSAAKMNVLHWHLTDDHSFPLSLPFFPDLAQMGAYSSRAIYSPDSVRDIVQYAHERGVQILPEIDVPGHTVSWFKARPEYKGKASDVLDPTRVELYADLEAIFADVKELFKTPFIHIGGDEVDNGWDTADIQEWVADQQKTQPGFNLIVYWLDKMHSIATNLDITFIMWGDFVSKIPQVDLRLYPRIKWHMWQSSWGWAETSKFATTNSGTIFSTDFYLDHLELDWTKLYSVDLGSEPPIGVAGAEACMWGEWVDESNVLQRTWPRAAAVGELLWSPRQDGGFPSATMRLAKWRCRMREFGGYRFIEPVGPARVNNPAEKWKWGTDKAQWYCPESDLVNAVPQAPSRDVPISPAQVRFV